LRGRVARRRGERREWKHCGDERDAMQGREIHVDTPAGESARMLLPYLRGVPPMKRALSWLAIAALAAVVPCAAQNAPAWPNKPVKLVAVFPPGGSVDQVARIFAAQLTTQLGQQVIVENRGGASGSIGTQAVATAPPDGYTWGV